MPQSILVVEDEADIRRALVSALKPLGEVGGASGGKAALRRIKARAPDLVLLDITMPDLDGLSVLRAARARHPSLIVVMLTGETDLAVAKQALELGARTYVTKPFEIDVVYGEVERLLQERSHQSAPASGRPWRVAPDQRGERLIQSARERIPLPRGPAHRRHLRDGRGSGPRIQGRIRAVD